GHRVFLAPYSANGKPLHVQGFLGAFAKAAIRNATQLKALADCGVPLVGLDPAMTLVYRQEYQKVPGLEGCPKVLLPQEWLMDVLPEQAPTAPGNFRLMGALHREDQRASQHPWVIGCSWRRTAPTANRCMCRASSVHSPRRRSAT
ncbi:hypothetical protein KXZ74_25575, partial [Escherichia coli]|nr:hypothetical protein [Escherichia coli]